MRDERGIEQTVFVLKLAVVLSEGKLNCCTWLSLSVGRPLAISHSEYLSSRSFVEALICLFS